jgi:hypothetical protein
MKTEKPRIVSILIILHTDYIDSRHSQWLAFSKLYLRLTTLMIGSSIEPIARLGGQCSQEAIRVFGLKGRRHR